MFFLEASIIKFCQIPWKNPGIDSEESQKNRGKFFHFIVGHPGPTLYSSTLTSKCVGSTAIVHVSEILFTMMFLLIFCFASYSFTHLFKICVISTIFCILMTESP